VAGGPAGADVSARWHNPRVTTLDLLRANRTHVIALAASHGARNVRVFGSVARHSEDDDSDIDLLVDLESGRSLVDLGELLSELQDLFGREVDVVTTSGLRGRIRDRVLAEAQPI